MPLKKLFRYINFVVQNNLTHREFAHGLKDIHFWYKNLIDNLVPAYNTAGRQISENEVFWVINYLKTLGKVVNQENVACIVGCHYTINKQFKDIYHNTLTY